SSHQLHPFPTRRSSDLSIGWSDEISDMTELIGQDQAKEWIRDRLLPIYPTNPSVASRRAGEILKFAQDFAENDLVMACDGENVRSEEHTSELQSLAYLV